MGSFCGQHHDVAMLCPSALTPAIGEETAQMRFQIPLFPIGLMQLGKAWSEYLNGEDSLQGQSTKKARAFCCREKKAEGDVIKVYNIPKAEG